MRGGRIYVKGNAGYRAGIHMKAYREHLPVLVIGGKAGSFLARYFGESKKQEKSPDRAPERAPAPANYSNYAPADYSYTPTFMDLDYEDIEHPF